MADIGERKKSIAVLLTAMFFSLVCSVIPLTGLTQGPNQANKSESEVYDRYYGLIEDNSATNPGLTLSYCDTLYYLARSFGNDTIMIDALISKTRMQRIQGSMDSAFSSVEQAIELGKVINDDRRLGEAHYMRGVLLFSTAGPVEAEKDFFMSFEFFSRTADSAGMATALNGIGAALFQRSNLDSATYYYLAAIKLSELNDFEDIMGKAYTNLGLIYDALGEDDKALDYLSKSAGLNKKLNSLYYLVIAYNGIANILIKYNKLDTAKVLYNKCLEISAELENIKGMADAYNGLADVADRNGQISSAKDLFLKAKHYYGLIDDSEGICITLNNLGRIESRSGNYMKAQILFDSALVIAREMGFIEREKNICWNFANHFSQRGEFEKAFKFHVQFKNLSDTILEIDKQKRIAQLKLAYDIEKERAKNFELKSTIYETNFVVERRTRQRNTYLFLGSGIILILTFVFAYYSQRARKNRIIAEQQIRQLEEEKKLLAARSIVEGQEEERKRIAKELHDGLGVLLSSAKMHFTNIRDKSPETQPMIDKAAKLLEQASGDVRRISHNMMPGLLTKFGLYEAVEDLFEQVDEMEGIHARVIIEGEQARLNDNTEIMVYRVIQEMVNNTLKHAEAKNIHLSFIIRPGKMKVEYTDDGKGFDVDERIKAKSIGLTSIQSRVRFLGGDVAIQSFPGKGVRYSFEIIV